MRSGRSARFVETLGLLAANCRNNGTPRRFFSFPAPFQSRVEWGESLNHAIDRGVTVFPKTKRGGFNQSARPLLGRPDGAWQRVFPSLNPSFVCLPHRFVLHPLPSPFLSIPLHSSSTSSRPPSVFPLFRPTSPKSWQLFSNLSIGRVKQHIHTNGRHRSLASN